MNRGESFRKTIIFLKLSIFYYVTKDLCGTILYAYFRYRLLCKIRRYIIHSVETEFFNNADN